jgi:alpha-L-fucosidase 2
MQTLWYEQPGERWFEALPVGNGRLGGMVYGGTPLERIDLSESTVWSGEPAAPELKPGAREAVPAVRELLFAGEYAKAQELADELTGTRRVFGTNLPLPHLLLEFTHATTSDYKRSLDLDDGLVSVSYSADGVRFTREVLASHPQGVLAMRITADQPGAVSFSARLDGSVFPGETSGLRFRGQAVESMHSDGRTGAMVEVGVEVEAEGGDIRPTGTTYEVVGADSAVLYVAVGTDWAGDNPVQRVDQRLTAASIKGYRAIRAEHLADHQRLMSRVSLELGEPRDLPTDVRRERLAGGERDDDLLALYFQYGRYLTMAGSRADSPLPLALQGIWNDGRASTMPWSNDFHLDINTQQNYWAAEPANLGECHAPLFRLIEILATSGERTATSLYGVPGWVAHTVTNAWGYTDPGNDLGWGLDVTGGAWLAVHLWEHYEYGGDVDYLREIAYPLLRGKALFWLSYLSTDPRTGHLVSGPSESPENRYVAPDGSHISVAMGNTVDRVFAEANLRDCAAAAAVLGVDADLQEQIAAARARLSPYAVGSHGQLQEWLHDVEDADPAHRHTSHLCALFPERQIGPRSTPELARAAEVTIERRQQAAGWEQTEWVEANFAVFYARLHNGDKALEHLTNLVTDASEANLLTYSVGGIAGAAENIYSFDGNAGGTAAVAELLLQSDGAELELLPALPAAWPTGRVRGLRARGGLTVDLTWTDGRLDEATIVADRDTTQRVRYGDTTTTRTFAADRAVSLSL